MAPQAPSCSSSRGSTEQVLTARILMHVCVLTCMPSGGTPGPEWQGQHGASADHAAEADNGGRGCIWRSGSAACPGPAGPASGGKPTPFSRACGHACQAGSLLELRLGQDDIVDVSACIPPCLVLGAASPGCRMLWVEQGLRHNPFRRDLCAHAYS